MRWRLAVVRGLFALGSALVTLFVLEIGLRLAGVASPAVPHPLRLPGQPGVAESFTKPDELLLYRGVPHARTYPWYVIEEHGWRTTPFAEHKPAGSFRVVVTGDSSTFGLGVLGDQHWPALLQRALSGLAEGELTVEVIDAAFIGYSTLQNQLQIERDLLPLEPDLVVVMVSGANDSLRVLGRGDAELVASQGSVAGRLARFHTATLLGLGASGWARLPQRTPAGSTLGRPRVTPDEAAENMRAMADVAPDRLIVGLFVPDDSFPEKAEAVQVAERVAAVALARGVPLADVRPAFEALAPFPLYNDPVHPSARGHALIAGTVLRAILPRVPLSPARRRWCDAWQAALAGELPEGPGAELAHGAPPGFRELQALYREPGLDGRLADDDAALPDVVRAWDPVRGGRCRARSTARLVLERQPPATLAELASFVRPADPLVTYFGGEDALAAAPPPALGTSRAAIVFAAALGLPRERVDLRVGLAEKAVDKSAAESLLRAVLELEPADAEARLRRGLCLRGLKRRDGYLAEFARLAEGEGALADFGRGVVAFESGDPAAEPALRQAIAGAPALGFPHFLLAQILLRADRLDEAANEFALASLLIGWADGLPAQLERIDARRRELAGVR